MRQSMFKCAVVVGAPVLSLATLCWANPGDGAEPTKLVSYASDATAKENKVYDYALMKALKTKLVDDDGETLYKHLQVVILACNSGGFASQAKAGRFKLTGDWSVHTASDQKHGATYAQSVNGLRTKKKKASNAKGSPDNRNGETPNPKEGFNYEEYGQEEREEPIDKKFYLHGWTGQYINKLTADKDAKSKDLAQFAKEHIPWTSESPKFEYGGSGNDAKVHAGDAGNHAVIWGSMLTTVSLDHQLQLMDGLKAAGYKDNTNESDTMDFAHFRELVDVVIYTNEGKYKVDRDASRSNLNTMIDALATALKTNSGNQAAFVHLFAHGNVEKMKAEKKPDAVPETPNQGKKMKSGDGFSLELDDAFIESFFDEVGAIDDPGLIRKGPPSFVLSTTEESFSGSTVVEMDIGGIPIGELALDGTSEGNDYVLDLDDELLLELLVSGVFEEPAVQIGFTFESPDVEDYFRIATEWDFELTDRSHYGVGLAAGPMIGVMVCYADLDGDHVPDENDFDVAVDALDDYFHGPCLNWNLDLNEDVAEFTADFDSSQFAISEIVPVPDAGTWPLLRLHRPVVAPDNYEAQLDLEWTQDSGLDTMGSVLVLTDADGFVIAWVGLLDSSLNVGPHAAAAVFPFPEGVGQTYGLEGAATVRFEVVQCTPDDWRVSAFVNGELLASGVTPSRATTLEIHVRRTSDRNLPFGTVSLDHLVFGEFPPSPGDTDGDGDVDLVDVAVFVECMAGPNVLIPPANCSEAQFTQTDLDCDEDVDWRDYWILQAAFTGSD